MPEEAGDESSDEEYQELGAVPLAANSGEEEEEEEEEEEKEGKDEEEEGERGVGPSEDGLAGGRGARLGARDGEAGKKGRGKGLLDRLGSDPDNVDLSLLWETSRLFVRNLPFDVTEEELRECFSCHGTLSEVRSFLSLSYPVPLCLPLIIFVSFFHAPFSRVFKNNSSHHPLPPFGAGLHSARLGRQGQGLRLRGLPLPGAGRQGVRRPRWLRLPGPPPSPPPRPGQEAAGGPQTTRV